MMSDETNRYKSPPGQQDSEVLEGIGVDHHHYKEEVESVAEMQYMAKK